MSDVGVVPQMAYVLPLRCRLHFTTNSLPSLLSHASRQHEIILVLDKCPLEYELKRRPESWPDPERTLRDDQFGRELVYRWIDTHHRLLAEYSVRVIESYGDERCWTGGLRAAAACNLGTAASTSEWVIVFGDEDLVFMPGWDAAMWSVLAGREPMRYVATPVMVTPDVCDPYPTELTSRWIHEQRERCCHKLTYPLTVAQGPEGGRIPYGSLATFAQLASVTGVHEEQCGERRVAHWVPLLAHRALLSQIGGYPTSDHAAFSYDTVLDNELGARGVTKRMPLDHMIFHTKHYVHMSDEIDRVWADSSVRDRGAHR